MVNRDKSIFFRRWLWTLLATLSLICPFRALAGSYVVSNTNDSGAGSFRQAILDLNAAADAANTITFNTSGTITLASLLDDVNEDVTFVGGSGVKVVLPSVGGGTNLSGLVMNGGGGTAFNGELPSFEVTGTADGILGVGGPIVEFNDDISGTISATAGTDEVYGIYGTLVRISDISGTVSAEAGRNDSIALVADAILDITGDVSGTLTATSGLDAAAVIGSPDVDIAGDISGVLTAHAGQDEAYGISADDFDLQGNLSGTISATADRDGAFGFYTTNTLYIRGTLSGTVSATAGGHTAIGLFNDTGVINGGAVNTALDISGNVSAEANGLAVGIAAWEAMNLNVTGSISGVDNSGGGAGYAVRSGRDDWVGGWAGDNNVDDVVQFGNGAFITGHVDLGGGTNALGMAGSGSMTGNLLNINTLDKADSGTWTINGRTAATNLSVAGGTLRMNNSDAGSPANTLGGTLTVNNGASMQLDVYQTAASSLDVTGAATVNGQVVFVPRALLASGTTFTAMTMASMAGTGQYTAPLFTVDTSSGNSAVLTKKGYTSIQNLSPNAQILADVLAPLTATATGDLSDLLVALENVTTVKEFEANLEELAPVAQITMLGQSFQLAGMFGEAVDLRLSEARAVFRALAQGVMDPDDPATWPLLASNGDLAALGSGFFLSDDRRTSIYLRLLHDQGGETGQETYFGNSFFSTGVSGGVDRLLTQGLAIGGNLAMATTEVEYDDAGESGAEITSWSLGGYASRFGQEWHVNAQALAGYNQYKVDRKIAFLARTAESTYNSIMLSASLSGGYDLPLGAWTISPAASVEYARLAQQGYEEQGAGVANLTVAAQNANSLATGLGLGVSRKCETETLVIVPELWALWTHEFFTRDMTVDTSMAGNPSQVYSMRGAEPDRDVFRLGTGITLQADNGSSFSLRYQGDFSEHTWSNGGVLEYRVTF